MYAPAIVSVQAIVLQSNSILIYKCVYTLLACALRCGAMPCFAMLDIDINVGADDVDFLPIQADLLCAEHDYIHATYINTYICISHLNFISFHHEMQYVDVLVCLYVWLELTRHTHAHAHTPIYWYGICVNR